MRRTALGPPSGGEHEQAPRHCERPSRHCEQALRHCERSEAIQCECLPRLDCFTLRVRNDNFLPSPAPQTHTDRAGYNP
ncbi:MAG: hypothetical protein LBT00_09890 [Spirochaetaceae bacterium]|nr:hypothetical protein [Spirochaetaceae bacterium]